jgi:nucleoside-diphosphate-sugar epimerase
LNNTIFITGSSGFVGKNLLENFASMYTFSIFEKGDIISVSQDIVIHLAGKAHDLKNTSSKDEYYVVNTEFTKVIFDKFLQSNARVFITLSSVKAAADTLDIVLTEDHIPNPITHYGKSKLLAEEYILSNQIPAGKRVYILRPCMIHGPGNKGNLNLLYKMVSKGLPWPLGSFDNKRSFCSIDNICFIINELIDNDKIPSGVYNIADDEPLSTNDLIKLIAVSLSKKPFILNTPKFLVKSISKLGDALKLPLNTERLSKLTETYIVSNQKIKNAINKPFPVSASQGLLKTFNSFNNAQ